MEAKSHYAATGLFVVLLILVGVASSVWLLFGDVPKSYDRHVVYMTESVSGLVRDSAVRYRGVDVGRVIGISLEPDNPERVRLDLDIVHDTPIKTDTVAVLSPQGLTGLYFVELLGGTRDAPPLTPAAGSEYPVIPAEPSLLFRLDQAISGLLDSLQEVAGGLSKIISTDNAESIERTLANVASFSDTLAARSQDLDQMLASAARTFENLDQVTARLAQRADALDEMVSNFASASGHINEASEDLSGLVDEAERLANSLVGLSNGLNDFLSRTGPGIEQFSSTTLTELNLLIRDFRNSLGDLGTLISALEDQPNMLIFGKEDRPKGPGE